MSYIAPAVLEEWQRLAADPDACPVCGCHRWAVTGDGSLLVCDVCHPGPGPSWPTRAEAEAHIETQERPAPARRAGPATHAGRSRRGR